MAGDALTLAKMTMLMPVEAGMFSVLRDFLLYMFGMAGAAILFLLLLIGHWFGNWLVAVFFIAFAAEAWKRRRQLIDFIR